MAAILFRQLPWEADLPFVLEDLKVDPKSGLTSEEVKKRQIEHGKNSFIISRERGSLIILFRQLRNPIVLILIFAFAVALFLGETIDAWAVMAIVIINVVIGFIQEFKAEKSMKALEKFAAPTGKVIRDGKLMNISSEEATIGDVLFLEAGDYVIADARIIEVQDFKVNEALLTGESLPVSKNNRPLSTAGSVSERKNMIFSGTSVVRGTARALVTEVGMSTEMGKIAQMLQGPFNTETPLQKKLDGLGKKFLFAGAGVIAFVMILGILRGQWGTELFMAAMSLAIATLPESLPTVVTVALLAAIMRLSKKRVLLRKMDAVEALGQVDVICTDKTGTLTTGKMEVVDMKPYREDFYESLIKNMVLCNNASLEQGGTGDPTEVALLSYVHKSGVDAKDVHDSHPRLREKPFDSQRKMMSVMTGKGGDIFIKGAPEAIIHNCLLSQEEKTSLLEVSKTLSSQGKRVLAFAGKSSSGPQTETATWETDMTFQGLVAMADPLREDSKEAMAKCFSAGIRVIMMTGDHPGTALSIGKQLGMESAQVITGSDWDGLSDRDKEIKVTETNIFARLSPENKFELINLLRSQDKIVAMTGDGVNDGPALKAASVGISMGKGGTEVARQASSMVLTDDNFSAIVNAIEEGRAVTGNIKRSLQFLLSQNLAELLFISVFTIFYGSTPLNPLSLLWINVVTDGVPALALAAERIPENFLSSSHRSSRGTFFDREFTMELFLVGILISAMTMGIYFYGVWQSDELTGKSLAFTFLILTILFRSLASRSDTKTFYELPVNTGLLLSILIPVILQVTIQMFPSIMEVFDVRRLSWKELGLIFIISPVPLVLIELTKIFRRRKPLILSGPQAK